MLKYIAIVAMTIDHIAGTFFVKDSTIWIVFRIIGRLTAPIMIYQIAEGFRYTHDLKKYLRRMFIFSLVSVFTFSYMETGSVIPVKLVSGMVNYKYNYIYFENIDKTLCICNLNVLFNFFLCLLSLTIWDKTKIKNIWKILLTIVLIIFSMICDWLYLPIILSLSFYYLKDDKWKKWIIYTIISLMYLFSIGIPNNALNMSEWVDFSFKPYRLGMFLVPLVIEFFYNGKPGKKSGFNKWFFYVYYPLHQIIIGFLAASF